MSREFKFRAWDIKNKRFVNIVRLILDQFGVLDYAEVVYEGKIYKLYPSEIVLEQDTGLKDKNGERICEGDIVKQTHSNLVCPVRFEYGGFLPFTADMMSFDNDYCEVIGNIHENPELIGGEDE